MLQVLDLASNLLTGSVGSLLGELAVLKELRVNNNQLTGGLPRHFASSHIEVGCQACSIILAANLCLPSAA